MSWDAQLLKYRSRPRRAWLVSFTIVDTFSPHYQRCVLGQTWTWTYRLVAVFLVLDVFPKVRVDEDTTSDHSPNFSLGTRHCEQSTCSWLGQVRQTSEERYFRSRQRW